MKKSKSKAFLSAFLFVFGFLVFIGKIFQKSTGQQDTMGVKIHQTR